MEEHKDIFSFRKNSSSAIDYKNLVKKLGRKTKNEKGRNGRFIFYTLYGNINFYNNFYSFDDITFGRIVKTRKNFTEKN